MATILKHTPRNDVWLGTVTVARMETLRFTGNHRLSRMGVHQPILDHQYPRKLVAARKIHLWANNVTKQNKEPIDSSLFIVITICFITILVLAIAVPIYIPPQPDLFTPPIGSFIIVKKEVSTGYTMLFLHSYPIYLFYYSDHKFCGVETTQELYDQYNVGDLYPNEIRVLH
jgi:hypothetical protein